MTEQELVDQMLAMAGSPPPNTDPDPPVVDPVPPVIPEPAPTEPAVPPAPVPAPAAPPAATPPAPAPAPAVPDKAPNFEETFDKSSKAFAELRVENKRLNDLLLRYGAYAKVETKDPKAIENMLGTLLTAEEAKTKNIDPLVLRTLQEQEAKLAAYEAEEIRKEANQSFIELQKQFSLDTKDLTSFAKQLSAEGINPFANRGVNLSQHYLALNYQKLIDRAKEAGRAEEAERQKRVASSTTPGVTTGAGPQGTASPAPANPEDGLDMLAQVLGIKRH